MVFNGIFSNITSKIKVSGRVESCEIIALTKLIEKHRICSLTNESTVNLNSRDDNVTAGAGLSIIKVDSVYALVDVGMSVSEDLLQEKYTITLTTTRANRDKLIQFLNKCKAPDSNLSAIYDCDYGPYQHYYTVGVIGDYWATNKQYISDSEYSAVDKYVDRLVNNPAYYIDQAKPYKETFLIYGPPGTGKTSIVKHMAAKYKLDVYRGYFDETRLNQIREVTTTSKGKPIVVIFDDVDRYIDKRGSGNNPAPIDLALSFLNGIADLHNIIVFITVNDLSRVPTAMYRRGRVDHLLCFKYLDEQTFLKHVGWSEDDPVWLEVKPHLGDTKYTASNVNLCVENRDDPKTIVELLKQNDIVEYRDVGYLVNDMED